MPEEDNLPAPEPYVPSQEEQDFSEIRNASDIEETIDREYNRVGNPIKYIEIKSQSLNKKVIKVFYYNRILSGGTKGYALQRTELHSMGYAENMNVTFQSTDVEE